MCLISDSREVEFFILVFEYKEIKRECTETFDGACDWLQLDPLGAGPLLSFQPD